MMPVGTLERPPGGPHGGPVDGLRRALPPADGRADARADSGDPRQGAEGDTMRLLEVFRAILHSCWVDDRDDVPAPGAVNLTDLVIGSMQRHAQGLDAKRLELTVDVQDRPVVVTGCARDLTAMLDHLLGNALKFTPVGGALSVELQTVGRQCVLTVADSGCGIPSDELSRIFDRSFRSSITVADGVTGAGLGLAAAQAIASMHGGRIDVASCVGTGSHFSVRLPTAGSRAPAVPADQLACELGRPRA